MRIGSFMSGQHKANRAIFTTVFRQTPLLLLLGLVVSGCTLVLSSASYSPTAATPVVVAATPTLLTAVPPAVIIEATPTLLVEAAPTLPVEISPTVRALDLPLTVDTLTPPAEPQAAPNAAVYSYG